MSAVSLLLTSLALVAHPSLQATARPPSGLEARIEKLLRPRAGSGESPCAGAKRHCQKLGELYSSRGFEPLWVDATGPRPRARALVEAIRASKLEGLSTGPYQLETLEELAATAGTDLGALATLELRLSCAALLHAEHRQRGRVSPEEQRPPWRIGPREAEPAQALAAIAQGAGPAEVFSALDPPHEGYRRLREALAEYRAIAARGGWVQVPKGAPLTLGSKGSRVLALRARLEATGDLAPAGGAPSPVFDEPLAAAVRAFQRRHGLPEDGVVGESTLATLRVPATARIRQILLNLERWRWVPDQLGVRYVAVNIPAYELRAIADDAVALQMRVVVGQHDKRTPIFASAIERLIINPVWLLPPRIAAEKLLERAPGDPEWVTRNGYELFSGNRALDPNDVDWSALEGPRLPFRVRQKPGKNNALGRLKLDMPNRFSVYLHDTPQRRLFALPYRALSHGCVRLERPVDLAGFLLATEPDWSAERVAAAMEAGETVTVALSEPVPVYLFYSTSFVDEGGKVHFRPDLYGADKDLAWRLRKVDRDWSR